jgi:hypothetical protein
MRDLRFAAFLLVAALSSVGWTQVQNSATTKQHSLAQAPAASTAQNENSNSSPTLEYFKLRMIPQKPQRDEERVPIGSLDRGFFGTVQPGIIERKVVDPGQVAEDFRKELDRGIRVHPAGAGMCGSIVSYNFSPTAPGEVPHLESVTTCTPADKIVQRHAKNSGKKPNPPLFLKTSSPKQ